MDSGRVYPVWESAFWVSALTPPCLCSRARAQMCTRSPNHACARAGAIAGIVDQPMQNFQRTWETPGSAGSKAKGVISGVGKGIVGVFTKPIGGAAELVSQTGYGKVSRQWYRCLFASLCMLSVVFSPKNVYH